MRYPAVDERWRPLPSFTTFQFPLPSEDTNQTIPTDINDAGQIVGVYVDTTPQRTEQQNVFLFSDGSFSTVAPNNLDADIRQPSINNAGQIASFMEIGPPPVSAYEELFTNGAPQVLAGPFVQTMDGLVNDLGDVAGIGFASTGPNAVGQGFLYSNGMYSTFDFPSGSLRETLAGFNNDGQIVGNIETSTEAFPFEISGAFLYSNGVLSAIDGPGGEATSVSGINDIGQIIGDDSSGAFIDSGGVFTVLAGGLRARAT